MLHHAEENELCVSWHSALYICFLLCRLLMQPASPRSKKFKGPAGLPLASPVVDPGHLLTKLNADIAAKRCKRHEFSLETCLGPTIFHRTKVCLCPPCCLLSVPVHGSEQVHCDNMQLQAKAL